MTENEKKELLAILGQVVDERLTAKGISTEKFMEAVDEKLNAVDRKYMPKFDPNSIKDLKEFERSNKFFHAQRNGDIAATKALSEGTDENGGVLVPTEFRNELIKSIKTGNSIRNLVRVIPVASNKGTMPRQTQGLGLVNIDEAGDYVADGQKFDNVTWNVHKFGKIVSVSNELYNDSGVNISQIINDDFKDAAIITENTQVLTGTGDTNNAMGIFTTTDYGKIDLAAAIKADDLSDLYFKLAAGYRTNAIWLLNTFALKIIAKLKDTTGRGLFLPDPRQLGEFTILGKKTQIFDEIPVDEVTTSTKIAFGDFQRAYHLFDRQQITSLTTNTGGTSFTKGTIDTRIDERFDGKVADKAAAVIMTAVK